MPQPIASATTVTRMGAEWRPNGGAWSTYIPPYQCTPRIRRSRAWTGTMRYADLRSTFNKRVPGPSSLMNCTASAMEQREVHMAVYVFHHLCYCWLGETSQQSFSICRSSCSWAVYTITSVGGGGPYHSSSGNFLVYVLRYNVVVCQ